MLTAVPTPPWIQWLLFKASGRKGKQDGGNERRSWSLLVWLCLELTKLDQSASLDSNITRYKATSTAMKLSPRVLPGALHGQNRGACDWWVRPMLFCRFLLSLYNLSLSMLNSYNSVQIDARSRTVSFFETIVAWSFLNFYGSQLKIPFQDFTFNISPFRLSYITVMKSFASSENVLFHQDNIPS